MKRRVFFSVISFLWLQPDLTLAHEFYTGREDLVLDVDGHIRLGALFPIHKQSRMGEGTVTGSSGDSPRSPCGEIQKEDGIQALEALLFALDEINSSREILPGVSLGVRAIDSCDDPYYAAERSVDLIRGFVSRHTNLSSCPSSAWNDSSSRRYAGPLSAEWECGDNIVGIIGPQTTSVSLEVASLGRLFHVPQVSYLATSVALCNRLKYPYFFRTVPSDMHQARAIVELLNHFNWTYASIVHSDSDYGQTGYEALRKHVHQRERLCLADPITIYNEHFKEADYRDVIRKLQENKLSKVVIVFADRLPAGKLLQAAKDMGIKDRFVWIGSDAWASRESVVQERETVVEGAIAVQPLRRELPGFHQYFSGLLDSPNSRNPWFEEYLHHYHHCNKTLEGDCLSKSATTPFKQSQQLYTHFVRDAIYAFAHALDDLQRESCGPSDPSPCREFKRRVFEDLKDYLQRVKFPDVVGHPFEFFGHDKHDGPPRYSIINFQKNDGSSGNYVDGGDHSSHEYDWHNVATFHDDQFSEWDPKFVHSFEGGGLKAASRCLRRRCGWSEVKVQDTDDACCWHCRPCTEVEVKVTEYECRRCPMGTRSDANRTNCVLIEATYLDYSNPWAMASIAFALAGIAMTTVTSAIFWRYWETPVVKACGRELSFLLLLGIFLSYGTTFAIVAMPSKQRCGLMRFAVGFCYTMCYAAVVTKINRVARIFGSAPDGGGVSTGSRPPRFTSPLSCLIIASGLISVEVAINVVWILLEPPSTTFLYKPDARILVCSGVNSSFVTGLVFPFFLILCATLYAFKTRKCPVGFNETRYIFLANTINTIHWIIYVPLYFASTDPEIRAVILAFSLSLSGTVQLSCMLFPRVYTVVFKPEKNTRGVVMNKNRGGRGKAEFSVPQTPPNSVAAAGGHPSAALPPASSTLSSGDCGFMTQMSTMSAPPIGVEGNQLAGANSTAVTRNLGRPPTYFSSGALAQQGNNSAALDKTSLPPSFANLRQRQMTWSFHSSASQADMYPRPEVVAPGGRHRSSSVCRGTQTTPSGRSGLDRKIKFTVSAPSDEEDEDDFRYDMELGEDDESSNGSDSRRRQNHHRASSEERQRLEEVPSGEECAY